MNSIKHKCKKCEKQIIGKIKIITFRQRLGQRSINRVDMYCESCFKITNKEKNLINERCKKIRHNKRKAKK
jgi:hypothetical protein